MSPCISMRLPMRSCEPRWRACLFSEQGHRWPCPSGNAGSRCDHHIMLTHTPDSSSIGASLPSARHVCFFQRHRPSRCSARPSLQHRKSIAWQWQLKAVTKELPIFPLNIVAFPSCSTPLHIFEARWALAGLPGPAQPMLQCIDPKQPVILQVSRAVQHSAIWGERVRSCPCLALHTQLS